MFVNGMVGGYGALMSNGYPTAARATAQNVLGNIGRAVGGFGPVAVGALAARYSFHTAIALLAGLCVLDMVATLDPRAHGRRTRVTMRGARPGARASLRAPALWIPDHSRGRVIRSG